MSLSKSASRSRRVSAPVTAMMLAFSGFLGLGLLGGAASERREALWGVVQLCVADEKTTGFPFPCLAVDLGQGEERGFVVLRPPVGRPDTILSPTRKSIGIEDSWLQGGDAPNFFALAWEQRRLAVGARRWLAEPDAMGMAVNSRFARRQDQLHIHIGCQKAATRIRLSALASRLSVGVWAQADTVLPGHEAWALRTGESDISRLRPFQLAQRMAAAIPWGDLASITLAVVPERIGDTTEFFLVAFPSDGSGRFFEVDAEDFLDARCPS